MSIIGDKVDTNGRYVKDSAYILKADKKKGKGISDSESDSDSEESDSESESEESDPESISEESDSKVKLNPVLALIDNDLDSDSKIYFTSKNIQHKFLENVKIIAVFEDPEDADAASCETDDSCEYYEKNYSIEPQMVHDVVNLIFKELVPGLNMPDDKLNNADESPR